MADELNPDDLYQRLRGAGQQHGPAFRGIVGLAVAKSGDARADVRLPASAKTGSRNFGLHPVMMDIAVQALGATRVATDLAGGQSARQTLVLPIRFAGVHVYGDITAGVCSIGSLSPTDSPDRLVGQVTLTDPDGRPLLVIDEVEMAVLGSSSGANELSNQLFTVQWEPAPLDKAAGTLDALLLIGDATADDPLLPALRSSLRDGIAESSWCPPPTPRTCARRSPERSGTASSWSAHREASTRPETTRRSWSWRRRARY